MPAFWLVSQCSHRVLFGATVYSRRTHLVGGGEKKLSCLIWIVVFHGGDIVSSKNDHRRRRRLLSALFFFQIFTHTHTESSVHVWCLSFIPLYLCVSIYTGKSTQDNNMRVDDLLETNVYVKKMTCNNKTHGDGLSIFSSANTECVYSYRRCTFCSNMLGGRVTTRNLGKLVNHQFLSFLFFLYIHTFSLATCRDDRQV